MSLVRTFGHAMLGAIAVPVTALSGLATLIFLLVFIFSSQYRWLGFVMAVFFGIICWCAYKVADSNLKCNTCHRLRFADVVTSFVLPAAST